MLTPEQYRRVKELFEQASDLPREEQQRIVEQARAEDPAVGEALERLLAGEPTFDLPTWLDTGEPPTSLEPGEQPTSLEPGEQPTSLEPESAPGVSAPHHVGADPEIGRQIGPYRLIRKLGAGGMGVVYEAEQRQPVRRKVAVKLIKLGMDSAEVIARFEAERQALALMRHRNVARVLDAGTDDRGRPYFVMEYIQGIPFTDYCDKNRLTAVERLKLFVQVCHGVQHAHQKGIIHRDIKPSNVLVEVRDGEAVPRIIDFGVAKATDQHLTEHSVFTEFGQMIGTPEYMSPEQADVSPLGIDTRTDVYSLGVLLYELLVGVRPFDIRELRRAGLQEIRRKILEETPAKPSTRFHSLGDRTPAIADKRGAHPATLERIFRGDLDWITMRALEKDRTRRYDSASALAEDIEHFLKDEPVTAGPPSAGYRIQKFVRRHRFGVTAAAALILALILGFVGTTVGLVRATRAERQARLEAATSTQVSEFLVDLFKISEPGESLGRKVTAYELLDKGADEIRTELRDQPELQGRLLETMGRAYRALGLYGDSRPLLEDAVEQSRIAFGNESKEVAGALSSLAGMMLLQGQFHEALPVLEEALAIQEKVLATDDPERARTLNNMGHILRRPKPEEALEHYRRALAIREQAFGPESLEVAKQLIMVGSQHRRMGNHEAAVELLERGIAIRELRLPPNHPDVANALNTLATLYRETERYDEARKLLERTLGIQEATLGAEHPDLAWSLTNLGMVCEAQGDLGRARELFERSIAIGQAKLAPGEPIVLQTIEQLVGLLERQGDDDGSKQWRRRLEETRRRVGG